MPPQLHVTLIRLLNQPQAQFSGPMRSEVQCTDFKCSLYTFSFEWLLPTGGRQKIIMYPAPLDGGDDKWLYENHFEWWAISQSEVTSRPQSIT